MLSCTGDRIPLEQVEALASPRGVIANLEAKAAGDENDTPPDSVSLDGAENQEDGDVEQEDQEEEEEEDESDEVSSSFLTRTLLTYQ